jgi:alkylation response protein AidB-like acyl-CoA dehydrogenase
MASGPLSYRAPVEDISLALDTVGLDELLRLDPYSDLERDVIDDALAEFGRFAGEAIAPTDRPGDLTGSRFDPTTGQVVTPTGFKEVFSRYVESGWSSLQFPGEFGGGGLPAVVGLAVQEMFASANLSLSLNPTLTQSGVELLLAWGTEAQKSAYLPKLLTSQWCGTMNLTEPESGSDLGGVRTIAEKDAAGVWRLTGTKIFITWGEHDLAENIIHFVLARTPGAPEGTKGLSLFLVPKVLPGTDGRWTQRNSLRCERIEEKLGIHASPTCVMSYEGAAGELIGAQHDGLKAMFTMMNVARVAIGIEGPAVGERAYQQAHSYAKGRLQGKAVGSNDPSSPIVEHPDVRRMLLRMRTLVQAGRLLCYQAGLQRDLAEKSPDGAERSWALSLSDLLTPIAKAWSSDSGFQAASLGVQVLGGAGYIDESGIAQRLRDSRIAPIYEGTNGIQAIDLVVRKIGRDSGATLDRVLEELIEFVAVHAKEEPGLGETFDILEEAVEVLATASRFVKENVASKPRDVLAGATSYLELAGITLGGWLMAKRALTAASASRSDAGKAISESNFFATEVVGTAPGYLRPVTSGFARLSSI